MFRNFNHSGMAFFASGQNNEVKNKWILLIQKLKTTILLIALAAGVYVLSLRLLEIFGEF